MEKSWTGDRQATLCIFNIGVMDKIGVIELEGMEFKAYHGCIEQEKVRGNLFVVDFRGELDLSAAAESDNLADTLNYGEIYDIVSDEMSIPSELLENVAGRILKAIETKFPELISFSVRVSKKRPPVEGVAQWSRVTLYHNR
jgi:dihydroneopterin aldolase